MIRPAIHTGLSRFSRRALVWGAPALLAGCSAAAFTPEQLLQNQLALIRTAQASAAPAAPGGADPVLQLSLGAVNGSEVCNPDCPAELTVPAGHVNLRLVCRYAPADKGGPYAITLAADVMAGHVYQLEPAPKPDGCTAAVTDVTGNLQKPRSDNPGIRG